MQGIIQWYPEENTCVRCEADLQNTTVGRYIFLAPYDYWKIDYPSPKS